MTATVIVVQALGIDRVGQLLVQADSTPAWLGFSINISGHLLGRAVITAWAEIRPRDISRERDRRTEVPLRC